MPNLPYVSSNIPRDLRAFLDRVRETLSATGDNRLATINDVINSSGGGGGGGGSGGGSGYCGTPPAPTGLTASGALISIILAWNEPVYRCHAYTEIYASEVDDIGQAVLVGMAPGSVFTYTVGGAVSRYFWIRFINTDGTEGPFNSVSGTLGQTSEDPGYLLGILTNQITESQLYSDLQSRINLIDGADSLYNSVNSRIKLVQDQVSNLTSIAGGDVSGLIASLADEKITREAIDAILSASIAEVFVSAGQVTASITAEKDGRISGDTSLATVTNTLTAAQADTAAGLRTEQQARADADSASVAQSTTLAAVGFAASAALQVEQGVRADADSATATQINSVAASYANDISAIQTEQQIRADAVSATATQISTVATAFNTDLSAIQTEQQARSDADSAFALQTTALYAASAANTALAQTEQQARTESDSAIASQNVALVATTGSISAALTAEQQARSDANSAFAASGDTLYAITAENTAAIQTEQQVRTDVDSATATQINTTLAATFGASAAVQVEQQARTDADSAAATQINTVSTTLNSNLAAIQTEQQARSDADSAFALQTTALTATTTATTAAIATEQQVLSDAVSAMTTQSTGLIASSAGNTAALLSEQQVRTDMDISIATQVSGLAVSTVNTGAVLQVEQQVRADSDSSISGQIQYIGVSSNQNAAALSAEQQARADSASALSSNVTTLQSSVSNNYATLNSAIQNEATTRANADTANATQISTLQATVNTLNSYRVDAKGFSCTNANSVQGIRDPASGAVLYGPGRSWNVLVLNRGTGAVVSHTTYDVCADIDQATALSSALNALSDSSVVVVYTYDEPRNNAYNNTALKTAIKRCGGTEQVLSNLLYRGAYLLVGIPGCGEGQGVEKYAGSVDSDTNAWVTYTLQLRGGEPVSLGSTGTVALQQQAVVTADKLTGLSAQYTVKIDNNGYVSGFGLASTENNGTPYSRFIFNANQFAFGAPGHVSVYPFVIQATDTTINGVAVPAGVYIDAAYIKNGTITNAKIGGLAVDSAKIADAAVTTAKITDANITTAKIADANITTAKIADANITTAKIADANITTAKIQDAAITNAKIGQYIQSDFYTPGSQGWSINKNGTAEFENIIARGDIQATSLNAATGTFTGSLQAATGTFAGALAAGVIDLASAVGQNFTYTNPGSYAVVTMPYPGTVRFKLLGAGGGGAGGNPNNYSGDGGDAGNFVYLTLTNVPQGTVVSVTVGTGGYGGSAGSSGASGGATSINLNGSIYYAAGGAGGACLFANSSGILKNAINVRYHTNDYGDFAHTVYLSSGNSSYLGVGGNRGGISFGIDWTYRCAAANPALLNGGAGGVGAGGGGGATSNSWVYNRGFYEDPVDGDGGDGLPGTTGGKGGDGYAFIEIFNPNGVVLTQTLEAYKETIYEYFSLLKTFGTPVFSPNGTYVTGAETLWLNDFGTTNTRGTYYAGTLSMINVANYSPTLKLRISVSANTTASTDDSYAFQVRLGSTILATSATYSGSVTSRIVNFGSFDISANTSAVLAVYGSVLTGSGGDSCGVNSVTFTYLGFF